MQDTDLDVVIIGAGISGLNFAYRLREAHPHLRFCILEARHELGGTWSLFKFPGIRSDSDLYSFSFPWYPWKHESAIAKGPLILDYLKEAAVAGGISHDIRLNHRVDHMRWSSASRTWKLDIVSGSHQVASSMTCRFILLGTGYYNYDDPLPAVIPGIADFQGPVVHPQFWPSDLDCSGKRFVIIGSGSTAITLLPSLASQSEHVTMLQRSPSYIFSMPTRNFLDTMVRRLCPPSVAIALLRFHRILLSLLMVSFCRLLPSLARPWLLDMVRAQLPPGTKVDPHFSPRYDPWLQRMCVSPDGDFFGALRAGSATVVTGVIEAVTPRAIRLTSGVEIPADVIVTATGLRLRVAGGIRITVDDQDFQVADRFMWKAAMLEDLPNVVTAVGYANASWTLGADVAASLACRLLADMEREKVSVIVPRCSAEEKATMAVLPLFDLTSTYIREGQASVPKAGNRPQWAPRTFYWKDLFRATWGDVRTGIERTCEEPGRLSTARSTKASSSVAWLRKEGEQGQSGR
ncbi:hypothetical protein XA68_15104 [Ophiocordyceps unilateralis]|uniref:Uncharacterized protein n=1 Tax=Ophiocordyceps unilateralis TaxID=268505 RepID=A0A2A9P7W1_OPHUN|nr:hypothetical protein XA68_15104 [Ophiocordyceps unilateralis]